MITRVHTGRRGQPRICIDQVAERVREAGSVAAAARALKVSRATVMRRLRELRKEAPMDGARKTLGVGRSSRTVASRR